MRSSARSAADNLISRDSTRPDRDRCAASYHQLVTAIGELGIGSPAQALQLRAGFERNVKKATLQQSQRGEVH
jgi:hypothetical protein